MNNKQNKKFKYLLQIDKKDCGQIDEFLKKGFAIKTLSNLANAKFDIKLDIDELKELTTRLMLGLWILGDQKIAIDILEEQYRADSKFGWLMGWDVRLTEGEEDVPESTLYGPDASEINGD